MASKLNHTSFGDECVQRTINICHIKYGNHVIYIIILSGPQKGDREKEYKYGKTKFYIVADGNLFITQ
jgi:hypothetical protein